MTNNATRGKFVRPCKHRDDRKSGYDQYDEYGHGVLGNGQPVEGHVRYLQQHPCYDAIGHERTKDAAVAKLLYQVANAILHRHGTPLPGSLSSLVIMPQMALLFSSFETIPQLRHDVIGTPCRLDSVHLRLHRCRAYNGVVSPRTDQ